MLKAHVRKSVGSIPTDCICFFFCFFVFQFRVGLAKASKLPGWLLGPNTPGIAQLAERETVDGYN